MRGRGLSILPVAWFNYSETAQDAWGTASVGGIRGVVPVSAIGPGFSAWCTGAIEGAPSFPYVIMVVSGFSCESTCSEFVAILVCLCQRSRWKEIYVWFHKSRDQFIDPRIFSQILAIEYLCTC